MLPKSASKDGHPGEKKNTVGRKRQPRLPGNFERALVFLGPLKRWLRVSLPSSRAQVSVLENIVVGGLSVMRNKRN